MCKVERASPLRACPRSDEGYTRHNGGFHTDCDCGSKAVVGDNPADGFIARDRSTKSPVMISLPAHLVKCARCALASGESHISGVKPCHLCRGLKSIRIAASSVMDTTWLSHNWLDSVF